MKRKEKVATDSGRVVVKRKGFEYVERLPIVRIYDANGRPVTIEELRRIRRAAKKRASRP